MKRNILIFGCIIVCLILVSISYNPIIAEKEDIILKNEVRNNYEVNLLLLGYGEYIKEGDVIKMNITSGIIIFKYDGNLGFFLLGGGSVEIRGGNYIVLMKPIFLTKGFIMIIGWDNY